MCPGGWLENLLFNKKSLPDNFPEGLDFNMKFFAY
jgi:hypothetical protein